MAADIRAEVRRLIRERGASGAARDLGMARETVLGIGAGGRVHDGTLVLAAQRIRTLKAAQAS
jgi:hypothetical protein